LLVNLINTLVIDDKTPWMRARYWTVFKLEIFFPIGLFGNLFFAGPMPVRRWGLRVNFPGFEWANKGWLGCIIRIRADS